MDFYFNIFIVILSSIGSYLGLKTFYELDFLSIKDIPNDRSMHDKPTKKSAGIIFIPVFVISVWCYLLYYGVWNIYFVYITLCILCWNVLGFFDDKYVYGSKKKIIIELLLCIPICFYLNLQIQIFGLSIPPIVSPILLSIYIIAIVNISNFMDGLDLYLTLTSVFATIVLLFHLNSYSLLFIGIILLITLIGFGFYNKPPAKLFMGDAGSLALGFILSLYPFIYFNNSIEQITELSFCFVFLPVFLTDGVATLIKRTFSGKNILKAHREHLYQRISMGILNKKTTTFIFSLANLPAYFLFNRFLSIGFSLSLAVFLVCAVYFSLYLLIDLYIQRKLKKMNLQ